MGGWVPLRKEEEKDEEKEMALLSIPSVTRHSSGSGLMMRFFGRCSGGGVMTRSRYQDRESWNFRKIYRMI